MKFQYFDNEDIIKKINELYRNLLFTLLNDIQVRKYNDMDLFGYTFCLTF